MQLMEAEILVVEDDPEIRQWIGMTLKTTEIAYCEAADAPHATQLLRENRFDLILMDLSLPRGSGYELTRDIDTDMTPVIVLTARTSIADKVRLFTDGAVDYITKPFDPMELVLRIKAALRRTTRAGETRSVGSLLIDPVGRTVTEDGKSIRLTPREFDLLLYLSEHQGVALSRERIIVDVWGYDAETSTRTVDVHIGRLRACLPQLKITTIQRTGYRLERV